MINWLKKKLGITALEQENIKLRKLIHFQSERISIQLNEFKEYTRVDADMGFRGRNTIILTGVYQKKGYVRFYDVGEGEFVRLAEELSRMKNNHYLIRNVDMPPSFCGVFDI